MTHYPTPDDNDSADYAQTVNLDDYFAPHFDQVDDSIVDLAALLDSLLNPPKES